jgi:hypothetical protein
MKKVIRIFMILAVTLSIAGVDASIAQEVISAGRLYNYAPNNEVAFDSKYKDKTIRVRGTVYEIGKDLLGHYFVLLEGDVFDEVCVQLYFSSSNVSQLSDIDVDDIITVEGRCTGRDVVGNVEVKNCRILR